MTQMLPTSATAKKTMEVEADEVDDPIPNELDNALAQLIPAITTCGSDPSLPTYLDLAAFDRIAGPALEGAGGGGGGGSPRVIDARVAGEIEVAFRHCMHEAGLALVGADPVGIGGRLGRAGGGGRPTKGAAGAGAGAGGEAVGLSEEGEEELAGMMAEPMGLLSLALEFVSREAELSRGGADISSTLSGLPVLLLEDFLESQGRKACKVFWSKWVEPNATRLTKLLGMKNNGRYALIRLSKKLAQRMSKTNDSSFCGQIHLFLAKSLTFFERSGLNVTGGANVDNVTAFEDEEQFRRTMMGFDGEKEAALKGSGSAEAATTAEGVDAMEVDSSTGAAAAASSGGGNDKQGGAATSDADKPEEFAVDYPLYQSFWRLQKYALQQDKAVKGADAKETWDALLGDVDKILGAFEANAFSEHDLRLAREKWTADGAPPPSAPASSSAARGTTAGRTGGTGGGIKRKRSSGGGGGGNGSGRGPEDDAMEVEGGVTGGGGIEKGGGGGGGGEPVYFGLKYLTSSRLLRLQLRDPTLRLQVLTQWLILAASLKSRVANAKDCPNSVEDLKPRIELAKGLVRATPPRGEEYLNMLQIVLNRESAWTQWKDVRKCKDVEPAAVQEQKQMEKDKAAGVVAPAPSYPNKRPRPSAAMALAERAKYSPLGADFPLEKMVKRLRAGVPSSQEHLEDQRMCAEDPDTPASELPSASPLYTWRALRLLGRENPANLVGCYDGDLVKAMERLDQAKNDAAAAKEAAAAAAAAAATKPEAAPAARAAEEQAPGTPAGAAAPPGPAAASSSAKKAEEAANKGNGLKDVAVAGEEDGEVEIKKEPAAGPDGDADPAALVSGDATTTTTNAPDGGGGGKGGGDVDGVPGGGGGGLAKEGGAANAADAKGAGVAGNEAGGAADGRAAPVAEEGETAAEEGEAPKKSVSSPVRATRRRAQK